MLQLNTGWRLDVTGEKSNSISCCYDSAVRILWDISQCGVYYHALSCGSHVIVIILTVLWARQWLEYQCIIHQVLRECAQKAIGEVKIVTVTCSNNVLLVSDHLILTTFCHMHKSNYAATGDMINRFIYGSRCVWSWKTPLSKCRAGVYLLYTWVTLCKCVPTM